MANAVACVSSWMTSRLRQHLGEPDHPGPGRPASPVTSPVTSAASSAVSGWPAHSTSWAAGHELLAAARSSTGRPFCRVIRPTKITVRAGRVDPVPVRARRCPGRGRTRAVSMPLRITRTRSGTDGRVGGEHVGPHALGHRDDRGRRSRPPPARTSWTARIRRPSCSAFHGRSGSSECIGDRRAARRTAARPGGRPGWRTRCASAPDRRRADGRRSSTGRRRSICQRPGSRRRAGPTAGGRPARGPVAALAVHGQVHPPGELAGEVGARARPAPPYTSGGYSRVSSATSPASGSAGRHSVHLLALADDGDAAVGDHEPAGAVLVLVDADLDPVRAP